MGRRPAARGLPWVRVVSVWDVMVSVWRPLGGRSKRLVSVLRPTLPGLRAKATTLEAGVRALKDERSGTPRNELVQLRPF